MKKEKFLLILGIIFVLSAGYLFMEPVFSESPNSTAGKEVSTWICTNCAPPTPTTPPGNPAVTVTQFGNAVEVKNIGEKMTASLRLSSPVWVTE